jgi:hypothetical protein
MTFPHICVLYPKLVHPLHFSSFYLTPYGELNIHSYIESTSPIFTCFTLFFYLSIPLVPSPQRDLFLILVLHCLGVGSFFSGIFALILYLFLPCA